MSKNRISTSDKAAKSTYFYILQSKHCQRK